MLSHLQKPSYHKSQRTTRHPLVRIAFLATALSLLLASGTAFGQAPNPEKRIIEDNVLTTGDNVEIHTTYYQSDVGEEAPVVILLHAEGSSRQVWLGKGGFAERLWNQGYAVIAVDLRKHGQSVLQGPAVNADITPIDRQRMVSFDMEAVKDFLFKEHMAKRLNMNKTGIVAAEMSGAVAIHYALADWLKRPYDDGINTPRGQDIRALILLSPESNPNGIGTGSKLNLISRLAANESPEGRFFVAFLYGNADRKGTSDAKRMYKTAAAIKESKERVLEKAYPFKFRGVELIGKNNARTKSEEHILGLLDDNLKKLTQSPWVDRRSKFDRNN